jgi:hypothetical protein
MLVGYQIDGPAAGVGNPPIEMQNGFPVGLNQRTLRRWTRDIRCRQGKGHDTPRAQSSHLPEPPAQHEDFIDIHNLHVVD